MSEDDIIIEADAAAEVSVPASGDANSRIVDQPNGTKTLFLVHPIPQRFRSPNGTERDEMIKELNFRRVTLGDLTAMANIKSEGDRLMAIFVRLTGQAQRVLEKMDAEDVAAAEGIVDGFLPSSLKEQTGLK